jgi:quercetin 2,3-dioxygenase
MLKHRRWSALSGGDLAWLKAKHHFAITPGANPSHGPVGSLIVWNDDEIAPSTGFPMHAHKDIEIITYVPRASWRMRTASDRSVISRRATYRS